MRRGQYREGVKAGGNRTGIKTGVKGKERGSQKKANTYRGSQRGDINIQGLIGEGITIKRGSQRTANNIYSGNHREE